MTKINGLEGVTHAQLNEELQMGGKFVVYLYCISVIILTFKRSSNIFFIPAGKNAALKGLPYTLLTLIVGWWGIPWGPIYTVQSLITNLGGGKDVTAEVMASLSQQSPA
ncbi:MAG: hypothetical protein RBT47_12645 [Anaerolineae bacterium]|jgi:hypothetical protein|nr:hypothetical protein [Anaerolineae bacterium]